jgi:hypothetical protein
MRSLGLALVLVLLPGALRAAEPTKVLRYVPYGPSGIRAGFVIAARERGSCWNVSLVTSRNDAWRCMVGNDIYDPCFSNGAKSAVACADDAFSKRLTMIALTKPLPSREPGDDAPWPWGLVLANGARCVMTTGATDAVDDMRLNYFCSSGGWVLGEVDRSTQPWRAFFSHRLDGKRYTKIAVREAIL